MNLPQIHIPPDLTDEARQKVQVINELLKEITLEVAELNAKPDLYTFEERRDLIERCEIVLEKFIRMREDLRVQGLEWSEWPDLISRNFTAPYK